MLPTLSNIYMVPQIVASSIPSVINTIGSMFNANANRSAQMRAQRLQNQQASAFAQDARNYNSPAHQVALMRQAGMNPNFIDGFESAQPVSPPVAPDVKNPSPFQLTSDSPQQVRESSSREAYNKSLRQTEDALRQPRFLSAYFDINKIGQEIRESKQRVSQMAQQITESQQIIKELQSKIDLYSEQKGLVAEQRAAQKQQNDAFWRSFKAHLDNLFSQTSANYASAFASKEQGLMFRQNADQIKKLTLNIVEQGRGLRLQNDFLEDTYNLRWSRESAEAFHVQWLNNRLQFDLENDKQFKSAERFMGLLQRGLGIANEALELNPIDRSMKRGQGVLDSLKPFSHDNPSIYKPSGFSSYTW